jgi:hypothetical protein
LEGRDADNYASDRVLRTLYRHFSFAYKGSLLHSAKEANNNKNQRGYQEWEGNDACIFKLPLAT